MASLSTSGGAGLTEAAVKALIAAEAAGGVDLEQEVDDRQAADQVLQEAIDAVEATPGPQGPAGTNGTNGAKGDKGDTGPEGPKGATGGEASVAAEKARAEAAEAALLRPAMQVAALGANAGPVNNSAALVNVGLPVEIGASATEVWRVSYWLIVEQASAVADINIGFSVPAGCTGRWGAIDTAAAAGANWSAVATTGTPAMVAALAESGAFGSRGGGVIGLPLTALIFGGGTAGAVQIQFAQNTPTAVNLSILKGSVMEALKVAS